MNYTIEKVLETRNQIAIEYISTSVKRTADGGFTRGWAYSDSLFEDEKKKSILPVVQQWASENNVSLTIAFDGDDIEAILYEIGKHGVKDIRRNFLGIRWNNIWA